MNNVEEGLKKLQEDLAKASPPRYCEAHKPCDAKEHQPGYTFAYSIFGIIVGSLIFGLVMMLGINAVLSSWLELTPGIGYWESVAGTAALYVLKGNRGGSR